MMRKIIAADSWDFGFEPVSMVKVSSRGLIGNDLGVLTKRASSEFADLARKVQLKPGEVPVHILAMGATERYGPNRNGDGFKSAALREYANTFEKFARFYRNHKNKNPEKSYGRIKLAYYNEPMRRIELLVALNGTEKVAKENGGLLADRELSLLESGKDFGASMACSVDHDVCSACGNKAANRAYYCKSAEEGGSCTLFGCASGLTKVADDGHIQHVDNPHPRFFDISHVFRPADRIAFGSRADFMKAASMATVIGGAELAEQFGVREPLELALTNVFSSKVAEQIKLAYELADTEDSVESLQSPSRADLATAMAFSPEVQPAMDLTPIAGAGTAKMAAGLDALACQGVLLPPREFVRLIVGESSEKFASLVESVSRCLPGIYNRLICSNDLAEKIASNPLQPPQGLAPASLRKWAAQFVESHSVRPDSVQRRAVLAAIRDIHAPALPRAEKTAAVLSSEAEKLARQYSLYKLAFLSRVGGDMTLTRNAAIRQNYVG